jgi:pectate lyase
MKKQLLLHSLFAGIMALATTVANAQTWDFSTVGASDQTNLNTDTENWTYESANSRWKNVSIYDNAPLKANGAELEFAKGLLVTVSAADRVRVDMKKKSLTLNGVGSICIPGLKAGSILTVECQTSKSTVARSLTPTNVTVTSGFADATDKTTNVGTVAADGDVTLTSNGGIYIYSITVKDPSAPSGGDTGGDDHSATLDIAKRQAVLTTEGNVLKYYNTSELAGIAIDKAAGAVTVTPLSGEWTDVFTKTVKHIGFSKPADAVAGGVITNGGVEITEARGWNESAYAKWNLLEGASGYNVYIKGGQYADYTKIDTELVRNYGSYGRADVLGLKPAADYALKIVPLFGGAEDAAKASIASELEVRSYDRSGFAHMAGGVGAYGIDGTLKPGARVLYVTEQTAKTVQLDVVQSSKGTATTFTGLQAIIGAYEKGLETRPLAVRIIGLLEAGDMDALYSSEGLQVKGKNNTISMNITIEGVGDDATVWGFGFLLRNAVSVELRNFGIMLCMDDCVSIDTNNKYLWIHNLDLFYGNTGSDSDQAKGDGTIDVKGNSQFVTISYNHLFDCGKSSLCGMKSESGPNYIDYHHNWFDHSDSRHPRVRTMSVHVWNNYFDGCAKYGVGATMGSSVFVESNYFRNTKNPMLSSLQGTDAKGDGTFSGEDGGIIKSFGNVYAEKGKSSNFTPITHKENAASFDCYEAASRDEQVPASYVALVGGTAYDNFDTNPSAMYAYSPVAAVDVPAYVTGYWGAGRLNKGDFAWTFDNATADSNYDVDAALKEALKNYTSTLKGGF